MNQPDPAAPAPADCFDAWREIALAGYAAWNVDDGGVMSCLRANGITVDEALYAIIKIGVDT